HGREKGQAVSAVAHKDDDSGNKHGNGRGHD
ncbi:MAG: hypothetical protein QOJ19_1639, partial [Acidimicrobiia bacterium]|nr:hypothetical protein [Acidimicrobiia bacterium]